MSNKENINEKNAELEEIIHLRSIYETKLKEIQSFKEKLDNWETQVSYSRPFNKLPSRVEHEILKKLDFKDYLNLALTCRKWYDTASTAPSFVKPSLRFKKWVTVRPSGISLEHPYYVRHILGCALIDRIKCEDSLNLVGLSQPKFLRFISENRSHFDCKEISIRVPTSCEESASLLYTMADMSSTLTFTRYDHSSEKFEKCTFKERTMLEKHLSHRECRIYSCIDSTIPNLILKQWTKGERPNLQLATVSFIDSIELVLDDVIEGLDEFVVDKQIDPEAEQHTAIIVVDGLPNIYVYFYRRNVKIGREGYENTYY